MRTFVINLDRDKERMNFALRQAAKNGYEIQRVPGVLGRELPAEELRRSVNRFRFRCSNGRDAFPGEIGCALSHFNIYRKMIEENIPFACILEDDIVILDGFTEKLAELEMWFDEKKAQVVRLNLPYDDNKVFPKGIFRSYDSTSACSYCLNLTAAKTLLSINYPLEAPCDHWPRWCQKNGKIELYDVNPKVCWHNNGYTGFSSVIVSEEDKSPRSGSRFVSLWFKAIRYVTRHIQRIAKV